MTKDKSNNLPGKDSLAAADVASARTATDELSTEPTVKNPVAEKKLIHKEINGPAGLEPTRYGDWEAKGRCYDF